MSRENPKPFKTIDEQVEILRSRGLGISDQNRAAAGLRKHPSEFFVAELDLVFDIHGAPAF